MAVAATGQGTPHLPPDVPAERWLFDPPFARARFLIVDPLWHTWAAVHVSGVEAMLAEVAGWPTVWEGNGVRVYERPEQR